MDRATFAVMPPLIFIGFAIRSLITGRSEHAVFHLGLAAISLLFPVCFFTVSYLRRRRRIGN